MAITLTADDKVEIAAALQAWEERLRTREERENANRLRRLITYADQITLTRRTPATRP